MLDLVYGSPYYVAPEVLQGNYNEKVDIWSIGVIMYTLLSGIPPFNGETEVEIVNNVKTGIYNLGIPELSSVSTDAKNLMANMLKFDQNERFSAS